MIDYLQIYNTCLHTNILTAQSSSEIDLYSFGWFSIGGLFHPADDKQEIAFRYAVEKINSDKTILPRSKLSAQIEKMSPQDSFHASKKGNFISFR